MKYAYLRVFAVADERYPLFDRTIIRRSQRSEYLQSVFQRRIDFIHRKAQLVYIPVGKEDRPTGLVILGRVGRSFRELVNQPPEQDFAEAELLTWRASNFLIDTGEDKDGQKIAMQVRGDVGAPYAVISSLIQHINDNNGDSGWILEVSTMTEPGNFWATVKEYKGELTAAVFEFVTPNVLGLRSQLNEGLKDARQKNNAHTVGVALRNRNGNLDLEEDNIKDAIDYVSEGGGTAKLKKGRTIVYNSEKDAKTVELDHDEPIVSTNRSKWRDFVDRLFR